MTAFVAWNDSQLSAGLVLVTAVIEFGISLASSLTVAWHRCICAFNIIWPSILSSFINRYVAFRPCGETVSPAIFWLGIVIDSSLPWLVMHPIVFAIEWPLAIYVSLISTTALIAGNPGRCTSLHQECPSAGEHFDRLQGILSHLFGNMFATYIPQERQVLDASRNSSHRSCFEIYSWIHICGCIFALSRVWCMEHAKRLSFLQHRRDVKHIDLEVYLESMMAPSFGRKVANYTQILFFCFIITSSLHSLIQSLDLLGIQA